MASSEAKPCPQRMLIQNLAPYFRHIKHGKDADAFFERLFDLWFVCWRLKLQDYGGNNDRLAKGMEEKMQWIKDELQIADSLAPEGPVQWDWSTYMRICESRLGVSAKRKHGDTDGHEDPRPRPQPRPKKAKTFGCVEVTSSPT